MKRRNFVAGLAGTPLLGSRGSLVPVASAHGGGLRTQAAMSATPLPNIEIRNAALLVMDFQTAWVQTLSDSNTLLSSAAQAIAIARASGIPVVYARVGFTPADYAAVPAHNIIFSHLASQPGLLDDDAPQMSIDSRVAPEPGDKVLRKTRVGAFAGTDLDGWLRGSGIDTLILSGISTSGVVLSTVCDAADRDYGVVVLADACADQDPNIDDLVIHKIFPQRAEVNTVGELPQLIAPGS